MGTHDNTSKEGLWEVRKKIIYNFLRSLEKDVEPISELEIFKQIWGAIEQFKSDDPEERYEMMAFILQEEYNENGELQYVPLFVTSEGSEFPDLRSIDLNTIEYWRKRMESTNHPVLRARYSSLLIYFHERVTGERPHHEIFRIFIKSVIDIAEGNLYPAHSFSSLIKKLRAALILSVKMNFKDYAERLIDIIIDLEDMLRGYGYTGLWGFSYDLLIKDNRIPIGEERKERLINIIKEEFDEILQTDNLENITRIGLLITDYYHRTGEGDNLRNVLGKMNEYMMNALSRCNSNICKIFHLNRMYRIYLRYGYKEGVDKISHELLEIGRKVPSELEKICLKLELPDLTLNIESCPEDMHTLLEDICADFTPDVNKIRNMASSEVRGYLSHLLSSSVLIDEHGRLLFSANSSEDEEKLIISRIFHIYQIILSTYLEKTIEEIIQKCEFNQESFVTYLVNLINPSESGEDSLFKGLIALFAGEYTTALHLLIPQVEAIIRELSERIGERTIIYNKELNGYKYITLGSLLKSEKVKEVLGEKLSSYLFFIYTDPIGLNLRNLMCHGIFSEHIFTKENAFLVLHSLLCLVKFLREQGKE